MEGRCGDTGKAVFAARVFGKGVELDKIEHLGDRDRDHCEIDPGAPEGYQADKEPRDRGGDGADDECPYHTRKIHPGEQICSDKATRPKQR